MTPEVQELISNNGNLRLAAERLGVKPTDLTGLLLSMEAAEFKKALQFGVALQIYDLIGEYRITLISQMDSMTAGESIRGLNDAITQLTALLNDTPDEGSGGDNILNYFENSAGTTRERLISQIAKLAES